MGRQGWLQETGALPQPLPLAKQEQSCYLTGAAPLCFLLLQLHPHSSSGLTIFRLVQRKAWHSRFSLSWFWAM